MRTTSIIAIILSLALQLSAMAQSSTNIFTDQITFVTEGKAPLNFHNWTFFWTMPEIEPDAVLDYVVIRPDGTEDFHLLIPSTPAGSSTRSDFSKESTGTDPSVFFGQHVRIQFRVTKGKMKFNTAATKFGFESFTTEIKAKTE